VRILSVSYYNKISGSHIGWAVVRTEVFCRPSTAPVAISYKEFVLLLTQISKLLAQDAHMRLTAADALRHPFIRQDDSSLPSPRIIIDQVSCLYCPVKPLCGMLDRGKTHDCSFNNNNYNNNKIHIFVAP